MIYVADLEDVTKWSLPRLPPLMAVEDEWDNFSMIGGEAVVIKRPNKIELKGLGLEG